MWSKNDGARYELRAIAVSGGLRYEPKFRTRQTELSSTCLFDIYEGSELHCRNGPEWSYNFAQQGASGIDPWEGLPESDQNQVFTSNLGVIPLICVRSTFYAF